MKKKLKNNNELANEIANDKEYLAKLSLWEEKKKERDKLNIEINALEFDMKIRKADIQNRVNLMGIDSKKYPNLFRQKVINGEFEK